MKKTILLTFLFVIIGLNTHANQREIIVMTHDSFSVSKSVLQHFQDTTNIQVKILKAGDAGEALNKAILSKNNPMADVFYGIDNTFLSRAMDSDIFEVYASPGLKNIPDEFKLDPTHRLLPVDYGDVCLNYDIAWFKKNKVTPPSSLEDLLKPELKDLLVVQNPATSSPGLAFLLTTIGHFGEDKYLDFWKQLKNNGLMVTNGWKDAYWGQFTAASEGKRPIVVSYATSPPAEVYFSKEPLDHAPTKAVTQPGTAFRQIEFAGILKGTKKQTAARVFMDFLLSKTFQEDIPLQMFVFPVNKKAALPPVFKKHSKTAEEPVAIDAETIMNHRSTWIEDWTDTVLRN